MQTISTILLLILFSFIMGFLGIFVLNFAGLPGALLAGKPGIRSKSQFKVGSIISAIGQTYIYLAYTAFIISWTIKRINEHDVAKFIVWLFAFLVVIIPLYRDLIRARVENKEVAYASPQTEALHLTLLLVLIGFFIFVFVPNTMNTLWGWIPFVTNK